MAKVHGLYGTPTYGSWAAMHARCRGTNSKPECYKGVPICSRWASFAAFYQDMGDRPDGMTLDRIDSTKGYSPANCRWATRSEQNNNRSNSVLIEFNGKRLSVSQWAREIGMSDTTIRGRLRKGWPIEKALDPQDFHSQSGRWSHGPNPQ